MNGKVTDETELVRAIQDLPASMTPRRDLWPGIAGRIEAHGAARPHATVPAWRRPVLAASLAAAFAIGIPFGRQLGYELVPEPAGPVPDLAMMASLKASEREYQAAFRQFITVGEARPMLETQAIQNIENSWHDLREAESALLAALSEYPENTYLSERLLDLRSRQLEFMRQLATLDRFRRRKT